MTTVLRYVSGEDVRLGDVIRIRRFLRSPVTGTVCYLPGFSPIHSEMEYEDVRQWAYRTADGTVYAMAYDPDFAQPPKSMELVCRGPEVSISPGEELM